MTKSNTSITKRKGNTYIVFTPANSMGDPDYWKKHKSNKKTTTEY